MARPRSIVDSATPSANAVAADVLLRLALLTGEADYDRRARSILRAVAPALDRQPSAFGRMLSAVDRSLSAPIDAVVAGDPTDEATAELRRAVAGPYAPDLVIAAAPSDGSTGRLVALRRQAGARRACHRVRLPRLCLRSADHRSAGGGRAGRAHDAQPGRKLSRTVRVAWSSFGSSSATDCQVPSAIRPPTTGTHQGRRDQQRQDVIRAVARRSVAVPPAVVARQEPIQRIHDVGVGAAAELRHHQARGRVWREDVQQPIGAGGRLAHEVGQGAGEVDQSSAVPGRDAQLAGVHRQRAYSTVGRYDAARMSSKRPWRPRTVLILAITALVLLAACARP